MSTPLNDAFVASQATRSSDRSGAPETCLRGRKLILARVVWGAAVILIVVLTSFTSVFARWTRRPSRTFLAITVAAYIIAGVMLWGRLEGWLKLPK